MSRRKGPKPQMPKRRTLEIKRHLRERKKTELFIRRAKARGTWTLD